jgi:hypothetical protein
MVQDVTFQKLAIHRSSEVKDNLMVSMQVLSIMMVPGSIPTTATKIGHYNNN